MSQRKTMHLFSITVWRELLFGFHVPFGDPVLQRMLTQLHLNVEHQVEVYLRVDRNPQFVQAAQNPLAFHDLKRCIPLWRALLPPRQTTAECLCPRRSCCSPRRCFCRSARPTALTCPSLRRDIWSPPGAGLFGPGKRMGRSSWGCGASSWDTPPGPSLDLRLQLWQLGSPSGGRWHLGPHLPVLYWGFERLLRSYCSQSSHRN